MKYCKTALPFFISLLIVLPSVVRSAGMTTHMWMTQEAMEMVEDPGLKKILKKNRDAVYGGAGFPDYGGASSYIKKYEDNKRPLRRSHDPDFIEAYKGYVVEKCAPDFSRDNCPALVAHLMGTAAHGMEDQVYNRLFMEKAYSIDIPADQRKEYNMDVSADVLMVATHNRWFHLPPYHTPIDDLIRVYDTIGVTTSKPELKAGVRIYKTALVAERVGLPLVYFKYKRELKWCDKNIAEHQGGVYHSAGVVARYWESIWAEMNKDKPDLLIATWPGTNGELARGDFAAAVFSKHVDGKTVTSDNFRLLDSDGKVVPSNVELYRQYVVAVVPDGELENGEYTLVVKGVRGVNGKELTSPIYTSFISP